MLLNFESEDGWVDNIINPLQSNRFELGVYTLVTNDEDKEFANKLRYLCYHIEGIGTNEITCHFWDDESIDIFKKLMECKFKSIYITQYRGDHSIARYLFYDVKQKAKISLAALDWHGENRRSSIIVVFELMEKI